MALRKLSIMDQNGDTRVAWNPNDPEQVEKAAEVFDRLRKTGHALYRVDGPNGETNKVTHAFDPSARLIAVPVVVGG